MAIGPTIKKIRKERKETQTQLAKAIGTKQGRISIIERGHEPTPQMINRIAEHFGLSYEMLLLRAIWEGLTIQRLLGTQLFRK